MGIFFFDVVKQWESHLCSYHVSYKTVHSVHISAVVELSLSLRDKQQPVLVGSLIVSDLQDKNIISAQLHTLCLWLSYLLDQ